MLAIAHDFADPMVLKAPDGYYYAYATQRHTPLGWTNIQVARSRDRKQRTEPGRKDLRRVLMLDRVGWRDGWPVVEGPTP